MSTEERAESRAALDELSAQVAAVLSELRQVAVEQRRVEHAVVARLDGLLLARGSLPTDEGGAGARAATELSLESIRIAPRPLLLSHEKAVAVVAGVGETHRPSEQLCGGTVRAGSEEDPALEVGPQGDAACPKSRVTAVESQNLSRKLSFSAAGRELKLKQQQAKDAAPLRFGLLEKFVRSHYFDATSAFLILLNTVVIAFEAQWKGLQMGAVVEYPDYEDIQVSGAAGVFDFLELFFGCVFAIELLCKIVCLREQVVRDPWNSLDAVIVASWIFTRTNEDAAGYVQPSLLRLIRLVRLLRLVRLAKHLGGFDSLIVMTTSMKGSISILFWTVVVLTLVLMLCALVLQSLCEDYLLGSTDEDRRILVFKYYGSFSRSLLTMFEITMGNWMPPCRALFENVSEWFMLFFLAHKLVIGYSCLNVINGIFMQETFKVASTNDLIMLLHRERAIRTHTKKMNRLFHHLDCDADGAVTLEEFQEVCHDDAVRQWLNAMELDVSDAKLVFHLLDEDLTGRLSAQQLVKGVSRMKGPARSIDLNRLLKEENERFRALAVRREGQ